MFNIGFSELVIVAVIALLVLGPEQLPEMAKYLARILNEFKRATDEVTGSFKEFREDTFKIVTKTQNELNQLTQINEPKKTPQPDASVTPPEKDVKDDGTKS